LPMEGISLVPTPKKTSSDLLQSLQGAWNVTGEMDFKQLVLEREAVDWFGGSEALVKLLNLAMALRLYGIIHCRKANEIYVGSRNAKSLHDQIQSNPTTSERSTRHAVSESSCIASWRDKRGTKSNRATRYFHDTIALT
jgi:hypothetical protein